MTHLVNSVLVNTACIADVIRPDQQLLDEWGQGCVELYEAMGEWAEVVTEEEGYLSAAIATTEEGWPGVFAYEVTEDVAYCIRQRLLRGEIVHDAWVRAATRKYITSFCSGGGEHAALPEYLRLSHDAHPVVGGA